MYGVHLFVWSSSIYRNMSRKNNNVQMFSFVVRVISECCIRPNCLVFVMTGGHFRLHVIMYFMRRQWDLIAVIIIQPMMYMCSFNAEPLLRYIWNREKDLLFEC